jgi:cell division transport system permease protein
MQLVGATKSFIRRPFIQSGIYQGLVASLLATALLLATIYLARNQVDEILYMLDPDILGLLILGVIVTGILLSIISTFFAVNKYLNLNKDALFT